MILKQIDNTNIDTAVKIQNTIFPEYSARINYEESISKINNATYYLVIEEDSIIGITGIYSTDSENVWLGWFGVLEKYRRRGYGSKIINKFEEIAKEQGFKYVRLYTDKYDNDIAINFYKANGYIEEDYLCEDDPDSKKYPILIFSKSLYNKSLPLWNNKNIDLTMQMTKQ